MSRKLTRPLEPVPENKRKLRDQKSPPLILIFKVESQTIYQEKRTQI